MLNKKNISERLRLIALLIIAILGFVFLTGLLFEKEALFSRTAMEFLTLLFRVSIGVTVHVFFAYTLLNWLNRKGFKRTEILRTFIVAIAVITVGGGIAFIEHQFNFLRPALPHSVNVAAAIFIPNVILGFLVFSIIELKNISEENRTLQINLAKAEKERVASQLVALQQQVNPHFMFNSLAVLSELIHHDVDKADAFIREFSNVYRYVLDLNDEPVVTVKQELSFLKSYLFLQKIRFGENLMVENHLDESVLNAHIPPLSLQLLFENAIKHNKISKVAPLSIFLKNENGSLVVKNSLNLRSDAVDSKGVGLRNLKEKYRLISEKTPSFYAEEGHFVAKIPLVEV